MKKQKIINNIISSLTRKLFDKNFGFYNTHYDLKNKKINTTKTTFVNAHCAYCLYELGYKSRAKQILKAILNSKLFDRRQKLFRYSIKNGKILNPDKNCCSNLLMIYALSICGMKKQAYEVCEACIGTLFNKEIGLFARSTRDSKLFVAQTNLWGVLALESVGMEKEVKALVKSIIKNFYNSKEGLLISKSSTRKGKYRFTFIFSDDNLLFCWIGKKYYPDLCKKLAETLVKSPLFDKEKYLFNRSIRVEDNFLNTDKSTYKNAVCLLGLKAIHHPLAKKLENSMINYLYKEKIKMFVDCYSDSNLLACYALKY